MSIRFRHLQLPSVCVIACLALSTAMFAQGTHDRTQFGHDISVVSGEEVGDVTCFGCSVRVRGHVATDVTVFGGSVIVEDEGRIDGDATVFGGGIRLDRNVEVGGDVVVFGGEVRRDPGASVGGDVTNFAGWLWMVLIFGLPVAIVGSFVVLIVWVVRRLTRPSVPATA
jgi:predicted acyltransferase (DUF342 family)